MSCCVRDGRGNHTRVGTVPDRRGRCGMNCGTQWRGEACYGMVRCVLLLHGRARSGRDWHAVEPRSCRHGAGSTPAAWDVLWLADTRHVMFGSGLPIWGGLSRVLETTTRSARLRLQRRMVGCTVSRFCRVSWVNVGLVLLWFSPPSSGTRERAPGGGLGHGAAGRVWAWSGLASCGSKGGDRVW